MTNASLVGRKPQLATLREPRARGDRWAGGLVLLAGEAGVGKSRLAREALSNRGALFVDAMAVADLRPGASRAASSRCSATWPWDG